MGTDPFLLPLSRWYERDDIRYRSKSKMSSTASQLLETHPLLERKSQPTRGFQRPFGPDQNPDWMRENTRLVKREICAPTNGAEKAMATMTAMIFGTKVSVIS